MKTEHERQEIIKAINILLHQAYDCTLDEIYALLQKIEDEEDEEDLKAVKEAREEIRLHGTFSWEKIKKEIAEERKQDVA
jgi:DNA-binding protein H-NS